MYRLTTGYLCVSIGRLEAVMGGGDGDGDGGRGGGGGGGGGGVVKLVS